MRFISSEVEVANAVFRLLIKVVFIRFLEFLTSDNLSEKKKLTKTGADLVVFHHDGPSKVRIHLSELGSRSRHGPCQSFILTWCLSTYSRQRLSSSQALYCLRSMTQRVPTHISRVRPGCWSVGVCTRIAGGANCTRSSAAGACTWN